jgi:hypothetical protein
MPERVLARPAAGDYGEYYQRYISLVPAGDLVALLKSQVEELGDLLAKVPQSREGYAYAEGKWTIREVIGHLTDTERVFLFRATAFSRNDPSPLPSFEQDHWLPRGQYDKRRLKDVYGEWTHVRWTSIDLLRYMPEEGLSGRGIASGNPLTALAAITMLHGHVQYHIEHLKSDYRLS